MQLRERQVRHSVAPTPDVAVIEMTFNSLRLLFGVFSKRGHPKESKGTSGFGKGPVPKARKEHIANREQIVYIASILAMGSTSGAVRRIRCEPVESRP